MSDGSSERPPTSPLPITPLVAARATCARRANEQQLLALRDSDVDSDRASDHGASLLSRGFVTLGSLISTHLAADILEGVSMKKAQVISNALQQAVTGELRRRCEEELRSSSALADLIELVFGVRTFRLSGTKRLQVPCQAEPQMCASSNSGRQSSNPISHARWPHRSA